MQSLLPLCCFTTGADDAAIANCLESKVALGKDTDTSLKILKYQENVCMT
jgi:hypothetical protein